MTEKMQTVKKYIIELCGLDYEKVFRNSDWRRFGQTSSQC